MIRSGGSGTCGVSVHTFAPRVGAHVLASSFTVTSVFLSIRVLSI